MSKQQRVIWLDQLRMTDIDQVGGKNASLGEMISQLSSAGVRVPGGFATTAYAFEEFLDPGGLRADIDAALSSRRAFVMRPCSQRLNTRPRP